LLTNNEENTNKATSKAKWTRKQARGILTPNERKFLQGKGNYSPNMVRYFKSHILRKTKKAIEDLDLIFKNYEAWEMFIDNKPDVKKIVEGAVKLQYNSNYRTEYQERLARKVKLDINKKDISRKTRKQVNEIINSVLIQLQTEF